MRVTILGRERAAGLHSPGLRWLRRLTRWTCPTPTAAGTDSSVGCIGRGSFRLVVGSSHNDSRRALRAVVDFREHQSYDNFVAGSRYVTARPAPAPSRRLLQSAGRGTLAQSVLMAIKRPVLAWMYPMTRTPLANPAGPASPCLGASSATRAASGAAALASALAAC
jgi:hypothetical protein